MAEQRVPAAVISCDLLSDIIVVTSKYAEQKRQTKSNYKPLPKNQNPVDDLALTASVDITTENHSENHWNNVNQRKEIKKSCARQKIGMHRRIGRHEKPTH
jgi:hypothetical protein